MPDRLPAAAVSLRVEADGGAVGTTDESGLTRFAVRAGGTYVLAPEPMAEPAPQQIAGSV
ncbi:hypothetical protein [Paenibacillus mucilaginosus]|uniref:hypothetical protein n=1 Tax=Paenibacillus mucilaginosus TaxID=61624 RepID=UPI00240D6BF9|nr:hypothetical protein [Paenibacillus mucilaginosus]